MALVQGKPLIQHVYERVKSTGLFHEVYVATDHVIIKLVIESIGGTAIMTDPDLPSGTDRVISTLPQISMSYDYIVNVQGDEALISIDQLGPLINLLNGADEIPIATLCTKNTSESDFKNPNCVKLTKNLKSKVLYFSRSPIPFHREDAFEFFYQHIGVYAFSKNVIDKIQHLPTSDLEQKEKLEQLRWMEAGLDIYASEVNGKLIGVDTPEDLVEVNALLS